MALVARKSMGVAIVGKAMAAALGLLAAHSLFAFTRSTFEACSSGELCIM